MFCSGYLPNFAAHKEIHASLPGSMVHLQFSRHASCCNKSRKTLINAAKLAVKGANYLVQLACLHHFSLMVEVIAKRLELGKSSETIQTGLQLLCSFSTFYKYLKQQNANASVKHVKSRSDTSARCCQLANWRANTLNDHLHRQRVCNKSQSNAL